MQSKLLTAIEKRQISRLGSTQTVPIDVRLICATNADIRQMVEDGNFRQDLLYPVSYTHLDVYKRQLYGQRCGHVAFAD